MSRSCYATTGDTYFYNKIHVLMKIPQYECEDEFEWAFYQKEGASSVLALPISCLKKMYTKSGRERHHNEYQCVGVYESSKRLRVLPFLVGESPRGEELIIAFEEIITGRHYALPLKAFKEKFKLDILYKRQIDIMTMRPRNSSTYLYP